MTAVWTRSSVPNELRPIIFIALLGIYVAIKGHAACVEIPALRDLSQQRVVNVRCKLGRSRERRPWPVLRSSKRDS